MKQIGISIFILLISVGGFSQDTIAVKDLIKISETVRKCMVIDSTQIMEVDIQFYLFELAIENNEIKSVTAATDSDDLGKSVFLQRLDSALRGFKFNITYAPRIIQVPILLSNPYKKRKNYSDENSLWNKYHFSNYNVVSPIWSMRLLRTTGGHRSIDPRYKISPEQTYITDDAGLL